MLISNAWYILCPSLVHSLTKKWHCGEDGSFLLFFFPLGNKSKGGWGGKIPLKASLVKLE